MAGITKAFDRSFRSIKREVNKTVLKVPEIEQKTLEATSNETWGPHGQLLSELARCSYNLGEYTLMMNILWKRLLDTGKNWRHVYKSLVVLEYIVTHGTERIVEDLATKASLLQGLTDFQYMEPGGRDQGSNVRNKSRALLDLIHDKPRIQDLRERAATASSKIEGYSAGLRASAKYSNSFGDEHGREGQHSEDSERLRSYYSEDRSGSDSMRRSYNSGGGGAYEEELSRTGSQKSGRADEGEYRGYGSRGSGRGFADGEGGASRGGSGSYGEQRYGSEERNERERREGGGDRYSNGSSSYRDGGREEPSYSSGGNGRGSLMPRTGEESSYSRDSSQGRPRTGGGGGGYQDSERYSRGGSSGSSSSRGPPAPYTGGPAAPYTGGTRPSGRREMEEFDARTSAKGYRAPPPSAGSQGFRPQETEADDFDPRGRVPAPASAQGGSNKGYRAPPASEPTMGLPPVAFEPPGENTTKAQAPPAEIPKSAAQVPAPAPTPAAAPTHVAAQAAPPTAPVPASASTADTKAAAPSPSPFGDASPFGDDTPFQAKASSDLGDFLSAELNPAPPPTAPPPAGVPDANPWGAPAAAAGGAAPHGTPQPGQQQQQHSFASPGAPQAYHTSPGNLSYHPYPMSPAPGSLQTAPAGAMPAGTADATTSGGALVLYGAPQPQQHQQQQHQQQQQGMPPMGYPQQQQQYPAQGYNPPQGYNPQAYQQHTASPGSSFMQQGMPQQTPPQQQQFHQPYGMPPQGAQYGSPYGAQPGYMAQPGYAPGAPGAYPGAPTSPYPQAGASFPQSPSPSPASPAPSQPGYQHSPYQQGTPPGYHQYGAAPPPPYGYPGAPPAPPAAPPPAGTFTDQGYVAPWARPAASASPSQEQLPSSATSGANGKQEPGPPSAAAPSSSAPTASTSSAPATVEAAAAPSDPAPAPAPVPVAAPEGFSSAEAPPYAAPDTPTAKADARGVEEEAKASADADPFSASSKQLVLAGSNSNPPVKQKESAVFNDVLGSGLIDLNISKPIEDKLGIIGVLPKTKLKSARERKEDALPKPSLAEQFHSSLAGLGKPMTGPTLSSVKGPSMSSSMGSLPPLTSSASFQPSTIPGPMVTPQVYNAPPAYGAPGMNPYQAGPASYGYGDPQQAYGAPQPGYGQAPMGQQGYSMGVNSNPFQHTF